MSSIITLVNFNGTDGAGPRGDLIPDANGDLFGTTSGGGANDDGTVFEIAKIADSYAGSPTTLVNFDVDDGDEPFGSLIADANGDLFGTTRGGGPYGYGTVFEIAKTANGYANSPITLVDFNGTGNGGFPLGSLITDANGDLFGTTSVGGEDFDGTVFEIAKTAGGYANTPTTLIPFQGPNGANPDGSLIMSASGELLGTTSEGGIGDGTVFGSQFVQVYFSPANGDGFAPVGSLIMDASGDLFGTTQYGGANNAGTVFEIPKIGARLYANTPTTVASFDGSDGAIPQGSLLMDANGDLFGTTSSDGPNGGGTIFEIAKTADGYANTPTTVASFDGDNGSRPTGSLIADANGDLFGTTSEGGANNDGTVFEVTDTGFALCFLAGTRISTPAGEVPVEHLSVGNFVLTRNGTSRRIVWIGQGKVLATRGHRTAATPVIVRKGALADNVPHRDLRVTKGHSLFVDNVLIPVEFLVNHRSILWDDHAQEVSLYHVELESHDILIAEGAPVESYRDDGNRWLFQNANTGWDLPPQPPCAPLLIGGPIVDAVWRRLLDRSGPRRRIPLTDDPDLHLIVDGRRLDAAERLGVSHIFRLPEGVGTGLRIVSRAAIPQELGLARDPRSLGIALQRIVTRHGTAFRITGAADPRLEKGFHAFEADNGFRWTSGDATLPPELFVDFVGPIEIVLVIAATAQYVDSGAPHDLLKMVS
jgi:uncharacterized repeat protein (TIGR03803 family)